MRTKRQLHERDWREEGGGRVAVVFKPQKLEERETGGRRVALRRVSCVYEVYAVDEVILTAWRKLCFYKNF